MAKESGARKAGLLSSFLQRVDQITLHELGDAYDAVVESIPANVIALAIMYFLLRIVSTKAYEVHLALGLFLSGTLMTGSGFVLWVSVLGSSRLFRNYDTKTVINVIGLTIVGTTAAFASLDYGLYVLGVAHFIPKGPLVAATFADHALWQVIDMIPSLNVWSALRVDDPVQEQGLVAGMLLLLFRLFVLVPLIALVKRWWEFRRESTGGSVSPLNE